MSVIRKIDQYLLYFEKALAVFFFIILTGLILVNIISRNIFHISFHKILEIAPSFVLWLSLLGATMAIKYNRHIRLELFTKFLSGPVKTIAIVLVNLFGIILMVILLMASIQFVSNEIEIFGVWGSVTLCFPLFFAVASFRFFTALIYHLSEISTTNDNDKLKPGS